VSSIPKGLSSRAVVAAFETSDLMKGKKHLHYLLQNILSLKWLKLA
jgi:hypothetical protein